MTYVYIGIGGTAAAGALMDRKHPLRGALLGAAAGATGGAALGAGGAAAGAGAAGASTGGAVGSGLVAGGTGATGTGFAATGMGGAGAYSLAGAPAAGTAVGGGLSAGSGATLGGSSGGLLSGYGQFAGAAGNTLQALNSAKQLADPGELPVAQIPQNRQGPDVTGLLAAQTQEDQSISADQLARRQQQQQWLQGLLAPAGRF
jgi:hypothetical protein